ncbi:MAG TPA: RNA polymerase sigma factor [Acetobacteraceae bacterium]|nr:RNA polymerase sigma factor [Acetobacteraceae bacterium]
MTATSAGTAGEDSDRRRGALMAAAQAGDRGAYEALLRDCLPLIRSAARGQGVAADRLEDVVQDVLLTLHRVRHTFDPSRSFNAWLRAISQRRAIDVQRRQSRQRLREVHDPGAYEDHPDPAASPDHGLDRVTQAQRMREALAALPPGQRQAVEMLALQDQSLAEAAAATGRSKVALKVNLHRAVKALRARLAPGDES